MPPIYAKSGCREGLALDIGAGQRPAMIDPMEQPFDATYSAKSG